MTEFLQQPITSKEPYSRLFFINPAGELSLVSSIHDGLKAVQDGGYMWLDYCDPKKEDIEPLISLLNIHPLSIEDSLNDEQLPKLDLFPNYSFMVFNIFETSSEEVLAHELDLALGKNFVVSITHRDTQNRPFMQGMERLVERESQKVKNGPSFLVHLLIDTVVDRKFLAIDQIETKLDRDEDEILKGSPDYDLSRLLDSRRDLMTIRKSVFYEREVLSKLIRQDSPFVAEKSLVFFRDVYDHLSRYYEISETARDQVTSLMEIHLSLISNRMAATSNRTNVIMRRLTLISSIFMPLTLISGIGGMSEFTMMVGQENWKIGYLVLLLLMIIVAMINLLLLQRMERNLTKEE
jgi:magnesium transporter